MFNINNHPFGIIYSSPKLIRPQYRSTIDQIKSHQINYQKEIHLKRKQLTSRRKNSEQENSILSYTIYHQPSPTINQQQFNALATINSQRSELLAGKSTTKNQFLGKSLISGHRYRSKIIVWSFATLGLVLQIYQISLIYFEFPTRIDIDIDIPRNITMPALSVCLALKSRPDFWKSRYLSSRTSAPVDRSSENILDWYRYLPGYKLEEIETEPVIIDCKTPFPELVKLDPNGSDNCENYAPVRESFHYNWETLRVHWCITYYYQKPKDKPIMVITADAKDFYQVTFTTTGNYSIAIMVHNPIEILHFIEADTFHFWTQQTNQMIIMATKVTTHALKAPYRTDCVDYNHLEFGRASCVNDCRVKLVSKDCPTIWPRDVPMTQPMNKSFELLNKTCWQPERHYCAQKFICKSQCTHRWYTTTLISSKEKRGYSGNVTKLFVRRPFGAELLYKYGPRLTQIEFICYVASCFGIWFGISISDLFLFAFRQGEKRCPIKSK